jgi:hypothetical protein
MSLGLSNAPFIPESFSFAYAIAIPKENWCQLSIFDYFIPFLLATIVFSAFLRCLVMSTTPGKLHTLSRRWNKKEAGSQLKY